jgi:peptidoglycan/xylan/chitin deacetylase (PgdA/CDA1 family)
VIIPSKPTILWSVATITALFLLLPALSLGRFISQSNSEGPSLSTGQDAALIAYEIAYGVEENIPTVGLFPLGYQHAAEPQPAKPATAPALPKPTPKPAEPALIPVINRAVPILTYHHIGDPLPTTPKADRYMFVSEAAFRAQVSWLLDNGYHLVTMPELFSGTLPAKPVVLTFDDGYKDNYEHAFPVLREKGQRASFFVVSGFVGGGFMTDSEVQAMSLAGMDIESHTVSHPHLNTLDPEGLASELTKSKADIEQIIGKKVNFLCFPFGAHNKTVMEAARTAGYRAAVMVNGVSPSGNMFELPRIEVRTSDRGAAIGAKIDKFIRANSGFKWLYN